MEGQAADVNDVFLCPICQERLSKPILQCKEGHSFCGKCIESWLDHQSNCPTCRGPLRRRDLARNLLAEQFIDGLAARPRPAEGAPAPAAKPPKRGASATFVGRRVLCLSVVVLVASIGAFEVLCRLSSPELGDQPVVAAPASDHPPAVPRQQTKTSTKHRANEASGRQQEGSPTIDEWRLRPPSVAPVVDNADDEDEALSQRRVYWARTVLRWQLSVIGQLVSTLFSALRYAAQLAATCASWLFAVLQYAGGTLFDAGDAVGQWMLNDGVDWLLWIAAAARWLLEVGVSLAGETCVAGFRGAAILAGWLARVSLVAWHYAGVLSAWSWRALVWTASLTASGTTVLVRELFRLLAAVFWLSADLLSAMFSAAEIFRQVT